MPSARRQPRPASPSGTATTALALLAIAVAMAARPALAHARHAPAESRTSASETQTIRDVAQAVVAAARQLVGAERIVPDLKLPAELVTALSVIVTASGLHPFDDLDEIGPLHTTAERLLDLPPPGC